MRTQKKFILLCVTLLCFSPLFSGSTSAQTEQERIEQLRKQIEELELQSKQFRSNIASEQAKAKTLKNEINLLKNQISNLEAQLSSTAKKIDKTKIEVGVLENSIGETQLKINKQRSSIGRLILFLNRQDSQDLLATVLKTPSISEFYRQNQYTENLSSELVNLVSNLSETKNVLEEDKQELEGMRQNLEELKGQQAAKKAALGDVQYQKSDLLTKTKGQEAIYQQRLSAVERQRAEFFTELMKLENEAIAGGLYILHITAKSVPPRGTNIFSWPYPDNDYRLTQGYGMTTYAKRGAYGGSPHSGIDFASGHGSTIKSIGAGEVVAFGNNPGFGNWIAIKHDNDMVSVYGHMSSFAGLRAGSRVTTDTTIGYEGSTGNSTGSHVHLSLYRDFFTYEKKGQLYFNYYEGTLNPLDYLP